MLRAGYEVVGLIQVRDCIGLQSLIHSAQTDMLARVLDRKSRSSFILVVVLLSFEREGYGVKSVNGQKVIQDGMSLGRYSPCE